MANVLDCRGLECPGPVLSLRTLIESESPVNIAVYVDNSAAQQNVKRFFEHQNYQVSLSTSQDEFLVIGTKLESGKDPNLIPSISFVPQKQDGKRKVLVLISSTHMGHGDDSLGDMLMFNFIKTLKEMGTDLWRVVFVNSGVSFTAGSSEAIPILRELAADGVQILACGACLAYFHILDSTQVGEVTNMLEIVTSMKIADSVISV